jgi:hypothetical protein
LALALFGLIGGKPKRGSNAPASWDFWRWWTSSFSDKERRAIARVYAPKSSDTDLPKTKDAAVHTLTNISGWFDNPRERILAQHMLLKLEDLADETSILTRHFLYSHLAKTFYPSRDDDPSIMTKVIEACEQQIALGPKAMAAFKHDRVERERSLQASVRRFGTKHEPSGPFQPPSHVGFRQLAIIREKEGNIEEALRVSRVAMKQGWNDDWEKRIARLETKLAKIST